MVIRYCSLLLLSLLLLFVVAINNTDYNYISSDLSKQTWSPPYKPAGFRIVHIYRIGTEGAEYISDLCTMKNQNLTKMFTKVSQLRLCYDLSLKVIIVNFFIWKSGYGFVIFWLLLVLHVFL